VVFSSSTGETPPVLETQTPTQNAVVGSAFSLTLPAGTFNDPDGGALTYTATTPSWLTFTPGTQTFSGTPTSAGTAAVQVTATDPAGLSASETFNIAVTTTPASVSLFTASNTPALVSQNDGAGIRGEVHLLVCRADHRAEILPQPWLKRYESGQCHLHEHHRKRLADREPGAARYD
jgi:hypothetical protein